MTGASRSPEKQHPKQSVHDADMMRVSDPDHLFFSRLLSSHHPTFLSFPNTTMASSKNSKANARKRKAEPGEDLGDTTIKDE